MNTVFDSKINQLFQEHAFTMQADAKPDVLRQWTLIKANLNQDDIEKIGLLLSQEKNVLLFISDQISQHQAKQLIDLMLEENKIAELRLRKSCFFLIIISLLGIIGSIAFHFLSYPINASNSWWRLFLPAGLIYLGMILSDLIVVWYLSHCLLNTHLQVNVFYKRQFKQDFVLELIDYQTVYLNDQKIQQLVAYQEIEKILDQYNPLSLKYGYSQTTLLKWLYKGEQ